MHHFTSFSENVEIFLIFMLEGFVMIAIILSLVRMLLFYKKLIKKGQKEHFQQMKEDVEQARKMEMIKIKKENKKDFGALFYELPEELKEEERKMKKNI